MVQPFLCPLSAKIILNSSKNISSFFGKIILARLEKCIDLEIIVNEKFIKTEISRGKNELLRKH